MKKTAVLLALLLLLAASGAFAAEDISLSPEREKTLASVQKISQRDDGLDLYTMEVFYEYDLDRLTPVGPFSDERMSELILGEAVPGVPVTIRAAGFSCTAFTLTAADGKVYMGRNYDWVDKTSVMMCRCHPKNGYASVSFSTLSHLGFTDPFASPENLCACLAAPLIPLDGMNEKGVAIAVLSLPTHPAAQDTGKPVLATPLLIRTVLDRAASVEEAIGIISQYDYYASLGVDCHFFITDASGNSVVAEFDCDAPGRPLHVTPVRTVTNFYAMYTDKLYPGQVYGRYGTGMDRFDRAEAVFEAAGDGICKQTVWDGCVAAALVPTSGLPGSYTRYSVVYCLSELTCECALHRSWETVYALGGIR